MARGTHGDTERQIAELEGILAALDQKPQTVLATLEEIRQHQAAKAVSAPVPPPTLSPPKAR